jgi:uncharacterized low-complexity protein
MKQRNSVAITLGAALLSTAFAAQAGSNPFAAQELSSGYSLAAHEKGHEGSCGEGKCGEGKCGGDKARKEGSCGEEGKAGHEGKCGAEKTEKSE